MNNIDNIDLEDWCLYEIKIGDTAALIPIRKYMIGMLERVNRISDLAIELGSKYDDYSSQSKLESNEQDSQEGDDCL